MFGESWKIMVFKLKTMISFHLKWSYLSKIGLFRVCKGSNEKILTFFSQTHVKLPQRSKKVGSIHAYSHGLDFHSKKTLKSGFWQNKQKQSLFYWLAKRGITQTLQGILNFLGAGGGGHTFGPWRKIHVLANSDKKKFAI